MSQLPVIGVLSLQGAFSKHAKVLEKLQATPLLVRRPSDLAACQALILPGGESTTISKRIDFIGLREPLLRFAEQKPLFGTCAGLILMAKQPSQRAIATLDILDVEVERNAYGSQIASFTTAIDVQLPENFSRFHAVFIRSPKIHSVGKEVQVLARLGNDPVLIQQGHHLAATFHPELTDSTLIHEYFLRLCSS